jgi:putative MATE family efflux protein
VSESFSEEASEAKAVSEKSRLPGIVELAWPAVLSNLLFSTVGFVDIKIVGSLGASAVAAATTGNRIFFLVEAVLIAVTAGTTAMVARAFGAGDRVEAERVTFASLVICVGLALLLSLPAVLFAYELASLFDLPEETITQAAAFIRWLSAFTVFLALSLVLGTALRAAGDTLTPLWVGAITNVLNVFLVYGFVYGRFGLPALGVMGAALASGLAFTAGALLMLWMWLSGRLRVGFRAKQALQRERLRRLFRIGYPAALEQVVWQAGFLGFLWIVALYGTAPYVAYGIGVQILAFSFVVGFGFSIAAGTHVGHSLGAGDPDGASESGWRAMWLGVGFMTVLGGAIIWAAEPVARFMIDDDEIVRLIVVFIYILGSVQPLMAIEFGLGGALRGAGDTRFPLFIILTGLVGVRVTLAGLAAWYQWPVEWVFGALIADYLVRATLFTWRFASGRWKSIDVH